MCKLLVLAAVADERRIILDPILGTHERGEVGDKRIGHATPSQEGVWNLPLGLEKSLYRNAGRTEMVHPLQALGHAQVSDPEKDETDGRLGEVCVYELRAVQNRVAQIRPVKSHAAKVCTGEIRFDECSATEVGAVEVGTGSVRTTEVCEPQLGLREVGIGESGVAQGCPTNRVAAQIGVREVRLGKVRSPEVGSV